MHEYKQTRIRREKMSGAVGIGLTILAHVLLAVLGVFRGITYIYPPPPEQAVLIEFEAEPEIIKPKHTPRGTQPQAEKVDRSKAIELVQKSEAQHKGTKANEAPEAKVDDFGDVETKQPVREKEINKKALFHAADNNTKKDTLAPQTAQKVSDALKVGHASGNTTTGKTTGEPNAHLKGRNVLGALPKPAYNVQEEGIVVVKIVVDQYGKVIEAYPGREGSTITTTALLNAAKVAAMNAHFSMSANAPVKQEGTITYTFKLK